MKRAAKLEGVVAGRYITRAQSVYTPAALMMGLHLAVRIGVLLRSRTSRSP